MPFSSLLRRVRRRRRPQSSTPDPFPETSSSLPSSPTSPPSLPSSLRTRLSARLSPLTPLSRSSRLSRIRPRSHPITPVSDHHHHNTIPIHTDRLSPPGHTSASTAVPSSSSFDDTLFGHTPGSLASLASDYLPAGYDSPYPSSPSLDMSPLSATTTTTTTIPNVIPVTSTHISTTTCNTDIPTTMRSLLEPFEAPPSDECCPICLEPLTTRPVTAGACLHLVHDACLAGWLGAHVGATCPVCRSRLDDERNDGHANQHRNIGEDMLMVDEENEEVDDIHIMQTIRNHDNHDEEDEDEVEMMAAAAAAYLTYLRARNDVDTRALHAAARLESLGGPAADDLGEVASGNVEEDAAWEANAELLCRLVRDRLSGTRRRLDFVHA